MAWPKVKYILCDLPESLFQAEVFLEATCPTTSFAFLPVQHACKLQGCHVDVVINQGSMQEMPPAPVQWWCDFIDRTDATVFISLNYGNVPIWPGPAWDLIRSERPGGEVLYTSSDFWLTIWKRHDPGIRMADLV